MNNIFPKLLLIITFISSTFVFCIFILLTVLCFDLFDSNLISNFFGMVWNVKEEKYGIILPFLGTLIISSLSLVIAFIFSFSICSYIFLNKYKIINIFLEKSMLLMASVPTVIYAFAALFTFVPFISVYINESSTLSILVASLTLSLLLIPTMGLLFLNSFRILSLKYESTCLHLGLSHEQFFYQFILKNSIPHMLSAVILAMARAVGDTMIILMLAGNALSMPNSIFDSTRSLTSHIALIFANDYNSLSFKAIFLCAFLLLCSNFFLILSIKYIQRKSNAL